MERVAHVISVLSAVVLAFLTGNSLAHHDIIQAINLGAAGVVCTLIAVFWAIAS